MKPARFQYLRPDSVSEAVELKDQYGADASVLAGGQSLIPVLNFRLGRPTVLIDLAGIRDLDRIEASAEAITVSAMARQHAVERDPQVTTHCRLLRDALQNVAHPAIRHRGTVCGSISHADPSAELPAVLAALGGAAIATSVRGTRAITADAFFVHELTNALDDDEIVTAVNFPALAAGSGTAFAEYSRRHGDFAIAGVAVAMTPAADGRIGSVSVGFCGIGPTPIKGVDLERALRGVVPAAGIWSEVSELAATLVESIDEAQASVGYRKNLVVGLTERALKQAWERSTWTQ